MIILNFITLFYNFVSLLDVEGKFVFDMVLHTFLIGGQLDLDGGVLQVIVILQTQG